MDIVGDEVEVNERHYEVHLQHPHEQQEDKEYYCNAHARITTRLETIGHSFIGQSLSTPTTRVT